MSYRHHPQTIRAKELACAAGIDPYKPVYSEKFRRNRPVWEDFKDIAFDELFEREAVDNIWWDKGGSGYTDRWDISRRDEDCHFRYGRCKSGQKWFWRVHAWRSRENGDDLNAQDWAATEDQALLDGTAAIKRLAAGRRAIVFTAHRLASDELKEINKAKRIARPAPGGSDSRVVEYLYDYWGGEFRITKKTRARIFYVKKDVEWDLRVGFIDRRLVLAKWPETKRELWDRDRVIATGRVRKLGRARRYTYSSCFFLEPMPDRLKHQNGDVPPVNIKQLKAEMAAAHPDKGCSSEAFIAARKAYLAALDQIEAAQ
jgi:hypothetical protein